MGLENVECRVQSGGDVGLTHRGQVLPPFYNLHSKICTLNSHSLPSGVPNGYSASIGPN